MDWDKRWDVSVDLLDGDAFKGGGVTEWKAGRGWGQEMKAFGKWLGDYNQISFSRLQDNWVENGNPFIILGF